MKLGNFEKYDLHKNTQLLIDEAEWQGQKSRHWKGGKKLNSEYLKNEYTRDYYSSHKKHFIGKITQKEKKITPLQSKRMYEPIKAIPSESISIFYYCR